MTVQKEKVCQGCPDRFEGCVRLADDQTFGILPEPPIYSDKPYSDSEKDAFRTGVLTYREAIRKAGWRKIKEV